MVSHLDDRRSRASLFRRSFWWAGLLLGFAMGGFFDGILLHQILQWHHLLSAVDILVGNLPVQILADGIFHAAMYGLLAIGLALLWRSRGDLIQPSSNRVMLGSFLIGFGVWHVVDAVTVHWALGLHHIRMASENVLVWDLIFFAFGVGVTAGGWLLLPRTGSGDGTGGLHSGGPGRAFVPALLIESVLIAAPVSALPPPTISIVMVLFRPGPSDDQVRAAVATAHGRVVWVDGAARLWVVALDRPSRARLLYRDGALTIRSIQMPIGCFASRSTRNS